MPRSTPPGIRREVLALAHEGMRQSAIAGRMGLTCATVNRIKASPRWLLGRSHTSSRLCFVGDGPTGSLHKCSGLDGADEQIVWNEVWLQNHRQPALVPRWRCLYPQGNPVDCQPLSSPLGVGTEMAEPDNDPLVACHLRWRIQIPTLPGRWQAYGTSFTWWALPVKCQAYRVQAADGSVHVFGAFRSGAISPLVLPDRYLTGELYIYVSSCRQKHHLRHFGWN